MNQSVNNYSSTSDPLQYLHSDSDTASDVSSVRVEDKGSQPQKASVSVEGVPVEGVIDSGADITIKGADLFKKVAAVACLKKKQLKKSDKVPYTYDQKPFKLDGKLELDITFQDKTLCTPVYLKIDAHDSLLLSEGVCRQLWVISYHPSITVCEPTRQLSSARVTAVSVKLLKSTRLPPWQTTMVSARVEGDFSRVKPLLVEADSEFSGADGKELHFGDSLVTVSAGGLIQIPLTNPTGFTQRLGKGVPIGSAVEADLVNPDEADDNSPEEEPIIPASVATVQVKEVLTKSETSTRKQKLAELLAEVGPTLKWQDKDSLHQLLLDQHQAFAVDEGERGDTDLVRMSIDTGDASPRKQPLRRTPFAARREVASQLQKMQSQGVIRPSASPWSSPVVLVRKKNGSLRSLNAVTKTDQFPLPRIDDLLDQLGSAKYFTTLNLAAGYWQVQMDDHTKEKTAFSTYQGLYEFNVMPFGLKNAPAVFQCLMQKVLIDLNPEDGPPFPCTWTIS